MRALIDFQHGPEVFRDAGGRVTTFTMGPRRLVPRVVIVTSPRGAHDVLARSDRIADKELPFYQELRNIMGGNLFDLAHDAWLPRRRAVKPVFARSHVAGFADNMAAVAEKTAASWAHGCTVDLDGQCRLLTMRALGHTVLGLDLADHEDSVTEPLRTVLAYAKARATRPLRAPNWLPTPARRRARAASGTLHRLTDQILQRCRADPTCNAPLVRALMDAEDPVTRKLLSDNEIRDELVIFILAGHDTTSTTLTYALWQLGLNPTLQNRIVEEVAQFGDRRLVAADVPQLTYTVQVLHEALRLCPPGGILSRMAMTDLEVDGYLVREGSALLVGIGAIHRDPELWDDPLAFDPGRFTPENSRDRDRWQYLPFGGGPRKCVGADFAMLEATLALATLIRSTHIDSLDGQFPITTPFTTVASAPIRARVRPR
jgi:cytochrome P450